MREARRIDLPQAGYWLVRLVKSGPLVPATITRHQTLFDPDHPAVLMERSPHLSARIGFDYVSVSEVWERRGTAISKAEYEHQLRLAHWARHYAPGDPRANPREPVTAETLRAMPSIKPPPQRRIT